MRRRLTLVFVLLLVGLVLVFARLFYWQVLSFDTLKGLSELQTHTKSFLPAKRGRIFTSDESPLVLNKRTYLIYADPQKAKNPDKIASVLSKELDIPISTISTKLNMQKLQWVALKEKVDETRVDEIKKYKMEGIGFLDESTRFYPEASMAAHLLGFVGKDSKGQDTGYFGLEGFYDEQLRGRAGALSQEQDSRGIPILFGNRLKLDPEDGRDIYLTIDKTVQFIIEKKLQEGIEKYKAKGGTVIVMEPQTGAILAMASFPSYDPVKREQYPVENYKNPAVVSSYEPGSTFKVLIMGAALQENKVQADMVYQETGQIEIGKYAIKTWNQKYHGEITLSQILEYSSNVGMVFVQKQLGPQLLLRYIEDLGFGKHTNIDLQEESTPLLRPKNQWSEIDYATASFGQGIAVTPLQMITAVNAIANGGNLMRPYVVKSIRTENGKIVLTRPELIRILFKKNVAFQVAQMMMQAVENGETKHLKPIGLKIAGKTGTAQIPIAGHYDSEKTIASFVGFAPVENPKFIMLVTLNEPTTSPWGSETAAPLFFNIAKELYSYLGISPTQ